MLRTLVGVLAATLPLAAHDWNGLCVDRAGNVFVVDAEDGQIWRVAPDGSVTVFVPGEKARVCEHPHHLAVDAKGVLWLASG